MQTYKIIQLVYLQAIIFFVKILARTFNHKKESETYITQFLNPKSIFLKIKELKYEKQYRFAVDTAINYCAA